MSDNPGTDIHQLLSQCRHRPVLYFRRQGQCPHEVGEIVNQGLKLEPNGIVVELAARQSGPFDGVPAFLDVLLRFASLIVEEKLPLRLGIYEADRSFKKEAK